MEGLKAYDIALALGKGFIVVMVLLAIALVLHNNFTPESVAARASSAMQQGDPG
jgi:hypothetical protein